MVLTPEIDIANRIASEVAGFTVGTNLFHGPPRPAPETPAESIFCWPTGGPPPRAYNGEPTVLRESVVQVRVRGDRQQFTNGLALARSVRDALHYAPLTGYIDVRVRESEPNYFGELEAQHPEWNMNVELMADD